MEQDPDAGIGYRAMTKFLLFTLLALVVTGCGKWDDDCSSYDEFVFGECPITVKIESFVVYGNDSAVNGQEQIVAGANDGMFQLALNVEPGYSDDAKIWVSDQEDLGSTELKKEIAHYTCSYYPFCSFNLSVNCNFRVTNLVICGVGSSTGNGALVLPTFAEADITPLLSGNKTNLFLVLVVNANGILPAQRSVPVTFRYN